MMTWWNTLSVRERWMVGVGAGLVVILLFYALVWHPLQRNLAALQQSVGELRADVTWMRQAAGDIKRLNNAAEANPQDTPVRDESLLVFVDRTARTAGLGPAVKRVEPQGANQLQIRLEQVSFDQMIRWLGSLQQEHGIALVNAVVDRQTESGRVDARLVLQGSGS
jgi:general secretion pathway protein M